MHVFSGLASKPVLSFVGGDSMDCSLSVQPRRRPPLQRYAHQTVNSTTKVICSLNSPISKAKHNIYAQHRFVKQHASAMKTICPAPKPTMTMTIIASLQKLAMHRRYPLFCLNSDSSQKGLLRRSQVHIAFDLCVLLLDILVEQKRA